MPKKSTTLLQICLLVLTGGFAAQHNRVPVDSAYCAALFVAVVIVFFIPRVRWFAFVLVGFTLFVTAGNRISEARVQAQYEGDSMLTRVRIADFPKAAGVSVSMLIEPIEDSRLPARSRVTWFEPPTIPALGETWALELRLRRPYGNSNPGGFSLENWMFREKLHAAGYVVPGNRNHRLATASLSTIERFRQQFVSRASLLSPDAAPVLAAIGVGTRHLIPRENWDRYARTGTSHLMAISGLHIGLAATVAFFATAFVAGVCRLRGNHLDRAIICSALVAFLYTIVSGFAVPSQRAVLMLVLAAFAFLQRRRANATHIVAAVALLVFAADPIAIMAPGFSLSFAAVVALFWSANSSSLRNGRDTCAARVFEFARRLINMQFALLFGLMPLTVLLFQRVAFVAPIANIVAVPIFSFFTVPLTIASMIVWPVWESASTALLRAAGASVAVIEGLIAEFARIPGASAHVSGIGGADSRYWYLVFLPALWVVLPRAWPGRWIAPLGVAALLLHSPSKPPRNCIDTHVLDVGQGLAVVVQSRQRTMLFDTGASYRSGGSAAQRIVIPFLRYQGVDKIDWLVVSHADDDHAGGVGAVIREMDVVQILAGELLPNVARAVSECTAGQSWEADGVTYRVLHPGRDERMSGNDSSCVIAVSVGDQTLIMTGDIEAAAEQRLLRDAKIDNATVVLMPHHGSLTSSSPPFVNRLRPDLAIASAGYDNRWGFPKERVVKRWEGAGATVLATASSGAISFRMCPDEGISLLREDRSRRHRFWHDSADL